MFLQAIVATNGAYTFTAFIYPTGGISLNPMFGHLVYMGVNALDSVHVYSHYASGTQAMLTIASDSSNTGNKYS